MQPFCTSCGSLLSANAHFCSQCGAKQAAISAAYSLHAANSAGAPRVGIQLDGGRYQAVRLLNQGSFGAVYEASMRRIGGRSCAIKELLDAGRTPQEQAEALAWFAREAELLMDLRHSMLPRILDQFSEHGRHYLVMDLIPGHDLEEELKARGGMIAEGRVLAWGVALCDVLSYLHTHKPPIIFRDLKPANIMLTPAGDLFLVDFGIARQLAAVGSGGTSRPGTVIGTPGYAPLEQYQGQAEPRSDIYALGATLYRLLTGYDFEKSPPLTFPPARQLCPTISLQTEAVLTQAMGLKPDDRFATADLMAAALLACTTSGELTKAGIGRTGHIGMPAIISTVAGNGTKGYSGDGGPALQATISPPVGLALDAKGNLFVADGNHRIRRVDAVTHIITTVAGNGTPAYSGDYGLGTLSSLCMPMGIATDAQGNLFVADMVNQRIRRVDFASGIISTVAGNGTKGYSGDGDLAIRAALYMPAGVTVDANGNLFIVDGANHCIRRVDAVTGIISTVAGNGTKGYSGDGGPAIQAALCLPMGMAVDANGNLFIADSSNNRIRRVDATTGIITTTAGDGSTRHSGDGGPAVLASLYMPMGVAVDANGNLLVADRDNNCVRQVDVATGIIVTVAGNGTRGYSGDGGPATQAALCLPKSVAVDAFGNLFIADGNHRIRRVDAA